MKFSLTISDLSHDDVTNILNSLPAALPEREITNEQIITGNQILFNAQANETIARGAAIPLPTVPGFVPPVPERPDTATAEKDKRGMPWDARIHAGTKTKNADGTWKKRKGVDADTVVDVEAEYAADLPTTPAAPALPPVPVAPPLAVVPPAPPVAATVPPARDFLGLMNTITNLFKNGQAVPSYPDTIVHRINQAFGSTATTITDIGSNPAMVDYAFECLKVDGNLAA